MNKLSTIYNVMKNMKDLKEAKGDIEVKVKKEDETVVQFNKSFDRNKEGKTVKNTSDIKIVYGDESFEHKSTTTISGDELHRFGRGFGHRRMMRNMMMKSHGSEMDQFPKKSKLDKIIMMIDLLNKAKLETIEGGNKKLSIDLADIDASKELKDMIIHRIKSTKKGNSKGMGYGKMNDEQISKMKSKFDCLGIIDEGMEVKGLKAEILINDKNYIENVEINIEMSNNEKKDVKFALKGKINKEK